MTTTAQQFDGFDAWCRANGEAVTGPDGELADRSRCGHCTAGVQHTPAEHDDAVAAYNRHVPAPEFRLPTSHPFALSVVWHPEQVSYYKTRNPETGAYDVEDRTRVASRRPERWEGRIDGRTFAGLTSTKSEEDARARTERAALREAEDRYLRPWAAWALADWQVTDHDVTLANLTPGMVVAFYGRGRDRLGVVIKVGRRNVEVAFTTPSSEGRVTRKAVPAHLVTAAVPR